MCLTASQRELEKYSLHPNMLKWRISSSRFFFNINKRKCLTFPPFPPAFPPHAFPAAFRHVWKVVSKSTIFHPSFARFHHHQHRWNPPIARLSNLGTYITTWWWLGSGGQTGVLGKWRSRVCFLMSPEKENRRERRQVLREVSICDWQYLSDWTDWHSWQLQIPLGGVI